MTNWIEKVTGSFDDKKRYRQYKATIKALPEPYRGAAAACERYLMYYGAITTGDAMMAMLEDLADLFRQSAADGTPLRGVVSDDPVEFCEAFVRNYADAQWIAKERMRLTTVIDRLDSTGPGQ
ncbi:DUF1048 domain-containing protein [Demequina sp.]|uniref:DUF1048 domain-containing protein n=1 Tax=Demequina sp. TaxID=2050685 RepID=UPI0025C02741|nr:DUF1048 domain-containing protein [Demequina sp.]